MTTDIADLVEQLCDRFDLDKNNVSRISIDPVTIEMHVYVLSDDGRKYVDHEFGNNQPVVRVLSYRVAT